MKTETFSFLPPMTEAQVAKQIQYVLENGWIPNIEYTDQPGPTNTYWSFWRLPLFNARTSADVLAEIEACKAANPGCYVKINGYDNRRQGQVLSFVVYQPLGANHESR
jgi:ribulose-bisphosphate carboxylase small chain